MTFEAIEAAGAEDFLAQLADALVTRSYRPMRPRRQEIPKDGGKVRVLSIPAIRDRVVQGAMKLILEPIFETDFQPGSFGYRPKRTAHAAVKRVAQAIVQHKTRVIDLDLRAYFDNVRHDVLLTKVAARVAAASRASPSEPSREGLRFVRRDPETGEDYLRIPMPSVEVLDRALAAIGEMLGPYRR